jgi:hypothetical protein
MADDGNAFPGRRLRSRPLSVCFFAHGDLGANIGTFVPSGDG